MEEELQIAAKGGILKGDKYEEELQNDLLKIGINVNSDDNCDVPIVITNYIYFRLQKLFPQPIDRRLKIMQLLGVFNHFQNPEILPLKLIYQLDKKFSQLRKTARKNNGLEKFEQEVVGLSLESIISSETPLGETSEPPEKVRRLSDSVMEIEMLEPEASLKAASLSVKLRREQKKVSYYRTSAQKLREALKDKGKGENDLVEDYEELSDIYDKQIKLIESLHDKISKLEGDVRERDNVVAGLNEKLQNTVENAVVDLKDHTGKFTVPAQACFGRLITECLIAHDKVPKAIQIIADLLGTKVNSLPSRWTVDRSLNFVHGLNSEHIVKVLSGCSNKALLSDETKKFTKQIDAFVVAGKNDDTNESFFLFIGGGRVPDKSSFRMFKELEDMLGEIAQICNISKETFWDNFVLSTTSLVSDEASTQKLLARLFANYKKEVVSKLDHLDEQAKAKLEKINTFFCRLHMLTNSTSQVLTVMLEHEREITGNNQVQASAVEIIIKLVAKKFSKRSSAKHSSACDWETYAHDKGLKFYKIDGFLGHRFQILYKIAVQIILNKDHLIDFLEKYGGDDEDMIKIKDALQNELIILHLSLLALFDVLVCSPFMRFSENCDSILETRNVALPLVQFFEKLIDEPMSFFLGESPFDAFPASFPKTQKGIEYENAIKLLPPIVGASELITMMAISLKNYFEKKLEPFLTGEFANPDSALEKEIAGAPSTNRPVESFFGVVDRLMNIAPNMTTYNVSIKAVAMKNKVFDYISSLTEKEREELYQKAYSTMNLAAQLAAEKKRQIQRELFEKMEKKALEKAKENSDKQRRKHKLASQIEVCGFWRSIEALHKAIEGKPAKDVKAWVKANIQYRKVVWTPKFEPKWLMQFSHKVQGRSHTFTCAELIENLKQLIIADPSREVREEEEE